MIQGVTDTTMLSIIGALMMLMVAVIGFFVSRWMNKTDEREERTMELILKTDNTLHELNTTLTKVNGNLEVYQATNNETIKHFRERIEETTKKLDELDMDTQDHEIRITILERSKA